MTIQGEKAPNQEGEGAKPSADGGGESKTNEQPPKWFTDYVASQEKRLGELGKSMARIDKRLKGEGGESPLHANGESPKRAPAPDADPEEVFATLERLGELKAQLSDEAKARLEELAPKGTPYAERLKIAEALAFASSSSSSKGQGASPASNGQKATRGHGASPAASTPVLPTSQMEYVEWQRTQPDKARAAAAHPDFDFYRLPLR